MQKVFLHHQIPILDSLTIQRRTISSLDLMEQAATTVADYIMHSFQPSKVAVMAGPGNNGGDGMVVARILALVGFDVTLFSYTGRSGNRSADCQANFNRLHPAVKVFLNDQAPSLNGFDIIIDALLGTGLTRKAEGILADVIKVINASQAKVISIDIPSGMGGEDSLSCLDDMPIVHAHLTIGFQQPKLAFLMPEAAPYIGQWLVTDIGLDKSAIDEMPTDFFFVTPDDIRHLIKPRSRFAHKGTMGRSLIFAGSKGMMGAAQLCAKGCLRSGTGLLTMCIPAIGYDIMQVGVPEAMAITMGDNCLSYDDAIALPRTDAIGIGPGLGRNDATSSIVSHVISLDLPMVIDADALWHLASSFRDNSICLKNTIITPHEGEFDNITHRHSSRYERLLTARQLSIDTHATIVLKGAFTTICLPDGRLFFNPTGNAGMATGGSGDVLTGILTALLAQGYSTADAAIIGVYIHGLAGDIAKKHLSETALIASDLISHLGNAWTQFLP